MSKPEASVDEYTKLKNELVQQIIKKQELEANLLKLEDTIYEKELEYFDETPFGNIMKGFDNFAKSASGGSHKKRIKFEPEDHIFSMSSVSYVKLLEKRRGEYTGPSPDADDFEDSVETVAADGSPGKEPNGTPQRRRKNRVDER